MSGELVTFVSQRKLGSPTRKAVMMVFAETANAFGKGIWKSHKTIASLAEISQRTVQRTIKEFIDEGLIVHVGYNTTKGVTTKAYDMDLDAIGKLDLVAAESGFTPIQRVEIESGQNGTCDTDDTFSDTDDTKPVAGVTQTVLTVLTAHNTYADAREAKSLIVDAWNEMAQGVGLSKALKTDIGDARNRAVVKALEAVKGDLSLILSAIKRVPLNPHWIGETGPKPFRAKLNWILQPDRIQQALELTPFTMKAENERDSQNRSTSPATIGERRRQRRGAFLNKLETELPEFRDDG